jgi:hypothetical protein
MLRAMLPPPDILFEFLSSAPAQAGLKISVTSGTRLGERPVQATRQHRSTLGSSEGVYRNLTGITIARRFLVSSFPSRHFVEWAACRAARDQFCEPVPHRGK